MTTAQDIIDDALQTIGSYAPGESRDSADYQMSLTKLNDMVDSWSNEQLSCFVILEQSVALQVGVDSYTVGVGGVVNGQRPLKLISGDGSAYVQDSNGNNFSIEVLTRDKWNLISNRSSLTQSNIPQVIWYDPTFPLGTVNFWPMPNAAGYTAYWDSYSQLQSFPTLLTVVQLPPGYKRALGLNLALEVWPLFKPDNTNPSNILVSNAREAKANVKRTNIQAVEASMDPAIVSTGVKTYNWQTDSYSR